MKVKKPLFSKAPSGLSKMYSTLLILVVLAVCSLGIWGYVAEIDYVIKSEGFPVEGDTRLSIVASPSDAILESIHAQEGAHVEVGRPLMTLSNLALENDIDNVKDEIAILELESSRLQAELDGADELQFSNFYLETYADLVSLQQNIFDQRRSTHESTILSAEEEVSKELAIQDISIEKVAFVEDQLGLINTDSTDPEFFPKTWNITPRQWKKLAKDRQVKFLQQRLRDARLEENKQLAKLAQANAQLERIKSEVKATVLEKLNERKIALRDLKTNLSELYEIKSGLVIEAQKDGIVRSLFITETGTPVREGSALLSYKPDDAEGEIYTLVSARHIRAIKSGQATRIYSGNQSYQGQVKFVSAAPIQKEVNVLPQYEVIVSIQNPPEKFTSTISVNINLGKKALYKLIKQVLGAENPIDQLSS